MSASTSGGCGALGIRQGMCTCPCRQGWWCTIGTSSARQVVAALACALSRHQEAWRASLASSLSRQHAATGTDAISLAAACWHKHVSCRRRGCRRCQPNMRKKNKKVCSLAHRIEHLASCTLGRTQLQELCLGSRSRVSRCKSARMGSHAGSARLLSCSTAIRWVCPRMFRTGQSASHACVMRFSMWCHDRSEGRGS